MNTARSASPAVSSAALARRAAFRPVILLSWAFVGVSAAMVGYLGIASAIGVRFESAIWIRCSLVLASGVVVLAIAATAARGSRGAWVRLRIVYPIIVAAVVVIVSLPGFLPDWVRIEQALCGLLLLPVAVLVNLPRMRALFGRKA
jgi:hypothetical protein